MSAPDIGADLAATAFKTLRGICKPAPLQGEQIETLAVERDDVDAAYRPTEQMVTRLKLVGDENPKMLLFGSMGTGKSTELARLGQRLGGDFLVVGLDTIGSGYDKLGLRGITCEGLALLCGLAIARTAQEVWDLDVTAELQAIESAARGLARRADDRVQLDIGQLMRGLALFGTTLIDPSLGALSAAVDLVARTAGSVSARVDMGGIMGGGARPAESRALVDAVNRLIEAVYRAKGRLPLLLIDETDKIGDSDSAMDLLTRQYLLLSLACPMVIAGPTSLQGDRAPALTQFGYDGIYHLYHVRVWQTKDPSAPDADGVAKMNEILDSRLGAVAKALGWLEPSHALTAGWSGAGHLFTDDARHLLASMSGGVIRDYLALVREACLNAMVDRSAIVDDSHAARAVEVARRQREVMLTAEAIDTLREVRYRTDLSGGDATLDLVARNHVLMYSNHHPWYYPHALLLKRLDSGAAG